jgi:hypothetical protein
MSLGKSIYNLLSNDANVSAIVGTKIFPYLAVDNIAYPYIVYSNNDSEFTDTKDGKSTLDIASYDIEIYSETITELSDLTTKVRNALDRYSGTVEGIDIQSIKYNAQDYGYADEDRVFIMIQSYSIRHFTVYSSLSKPTNLAGSASSTTQIDLTWTDNSTGESGFEVWRSSNLTSWSLITTTAANATSYSNTGLTATTQYYYRVRATDGTDGGEWSNIIGVRTDNSGGASPSGIAYFDVSLTGQLTSYRTGDDAWRLLNSEYVNTQPAYPVSYAQLDTTALDPFRTLLNNNAFGNKNRFTDENGLQVYGNNYAIDHLTNRGWYLTVQSAVTWNNAIDNSVAFTVLGYTDFYLPSIKEMESIVDVEDNDVLIYSPFNFSNAIGGVDLWTSTTNKGETTRAFIVQPLVSGTQSYNVARTLKTSTEKHYIVRKHY